MENTLPIEPTGSTVPGNTGSKVESTEKKTVNVPEMGPGWIVLRENASEIMVTFIIIIMLLVTVINLYSANETGITDLMKSALVPTITGFLGFLAKKKMND